MNPEAIVFVVDDDPEVRKSLSRLLEEVDLPVRAFGTGNEFLQAYDPDQPGCLVLDVRMPGLSGIDLQQKLQAEGMTIPVIIITGHGDIPMAVEAVQRGALDFIEKPFRAQPLLERINQALTRDAEIRRSKAESQRIIERMALLTTRQRQVFTLAAAGETTKTIAATLSLSPKTVDYHRAQIMDKMQARSVVDLARMVRIVENDKQAHPHCQSVQRLPQNT